MNQFSNSLFRRGLPALLAAALHLTLSGPVAALGSEESASLLPVAVSVAAPAVVLSAGVGLTVVAIESTAKGTVWVLQRASDGVKVSVQFSGNVARGAALAAGTVVMVSVITTGAVLSAAGEAIAFIPNEVGASLIHNERVTERDRVR